MVEGHQWILGWKVVQLAGFDTGPRVDGAETGVAGGVSLERTTMRALATGL